MPWTNGTFTLAAAATDAFPGKVLASADWNTIFGQIIDGMQDANVLSVIEFGAVGDGTTNDTTAITAANAAAGAKYVPTGLYATTLASTALDGIFWGHGQIRTGATNKRAPFFSAVKANSAYTASNADSIETAFTGTFTNCQFPVEHRITGAATLTQPLTGYVYSPWAYGHYEWMLNSSGWNEATATNDGRTAACMYRVQVENAGQGDCVAFNAAGVVSGTRAGSTSFLANPAVTLFNGNCFGATDGVYLNAGEISLDDLGHDVAGLGWVINMNRSNVTGAKNAFWAGFRAQSIGSADVNAAYSAFGKYDVGLDFSHITTDANKAAAALKADDRIYLNASSSNNFYATALGSIYLTYSSTLTSVISSSGLQSISPTAGVGYTTGAGGTVTQGAGSGKATAVTLNKVTGQITMNNAVLNAGAFIGFAFSNSTIGAADLVYAQHVSGGTAGSYRISVDAILATSCNVRIQNVSGGNLSEAIVIGFIILKGATS